MVPLVSRWYSVGILGCSAGVPGNVQLFRHCSGVFRCSAGVPCSGVPGFIVYPYILYQFISSFRGALHHIVFSPVLGELEFRLRR